MCGRYPQHTKPSRLATIFDAQLSDTLKDWHARYNIAPTSSALVVRAAGNVRTIEAMRWGLIPSWSKEPTSKFATFNARSEDAASKPTYRGPMKHRRCLVPTDGFYEWQRHGDRKQPYLMRMADDEPFAFAGLWDSWRDELQSFSILTTGPNEVMKPIHNRMPVIVQPDDYSRWLDPEITDPAEVADILRPFSADQMYAVPVSDYVNNARHEGPQCLTVAS